MCILISFLAYVIAQFAIIPYEFILQLAAAYGSTLYL